MISYSSRDEIGKEFKWDLTPLYKNDEAFLKDVHMLDTLCDDVLKYKGKLTASKENLFNAIETSLTLSRLSHNVYVYAHLNSDLDLKNSKYQAYQNMVKSKLVEISSKLAFFEPELLACDEKKVRKYAEEYKNGKYLLYIDDILRGKPYVLSESEEKIISSFGELTSAPASIFSMLNNADLTFGTIKDADGNDVELTHGNYVLFLESKDANVRKAAFDRMYDVFKDHTNTLAEVLSTEVKKRVSLAKIRGYDSAMHSALFSNNIPTALYDTLIEKVNQSLPKIHKYNKMRKEILGLEAMHMYDMYVPLIKDFEYKVTYDEAKEHIVNALSLMGEDYVHNLKRAFSENWIDLYETPGKRSGAYSSGSYDSNPYILMNWQDNVNNMFTLAHELGHSMHSYYSSTNQDYVYSSYSIFLAEIASTFNESVLNNYLLSKETDVNKRLYLLNHFIDTIRGTIIRQTMFAEFERDIHKVVEEGESLTSETLSDMYYELVQKYFGDAVEIDDKIRYEWSRIPHFYYNFYVFQYATGLSAALSLSKRVMDGKKGALEQYFTFLKAGSSKYPTNVLQDAGIDMLKGDVIDEALAVFDELIEEFNELISFERVKK